MHEMIYGCSANLHLVGLLSVPPGFIVDVEEFPPETQVCVRRIKTRLKKRKVGLMWLILLFNHQPFMENDVSIVPCVINPFVMVGKLFFCR